MNPGMSSPEIVAETTSVMPSSRTLAMVRPVEPTLKSKTLQMAVWLTPGKRALFSSMTFWPTTLPCRFARSPSGATSFSPVTSEVLSTQSPAA